MTVWVHCDHDGCANRVHPVTDKYALSFEIPVQGRDWQPPRYDDAGTRYDYCPAHTKRERQA